MKGIDLVSEWATGCNHMVRWGVLENVSELLLKVLCFNWNSMPVAITTTTTPTSTATTTTATTVAAAAGDDDDEIDENSNMIPKQDLIVHLGILQNSPTKKIFIISAIMYKNYIDM